MRLSIRTFLLTCIAGAALVAGPAFARHGMDDGPEDLGDRGDVPDLSVPEDHGDVTDSVADVSDKGDGADRATDISDHGGDSADRSGSGSGDDRVELSSNSGSSDDKSESSSDADDKSGSTSSGSDSSGGGSSGSDDDGASGDNSGSGSSGSGSSGSDDATADDNSGSGSSGSGSGKDGESDDSDVKYARAGGPSAFEMDNEGRERRSSEVLFLGGEDQIEAVRRAGYEVVVEKPLGALGNSLMRIRIREGEGVETSLKTLRALAPNAWIDANYVYRASSGGASAPAGPGPTPNQLRRGRIGVIDTGADAGLGGLWMGKTRAFASSPYTPRSHGTNVARIAAARGVEVDVADVFDLDSKGGAIASADAIARALDWLVARGAPVINISIEGPPNKVLDEVIQRALKAGAIVVAAAGNEGPSAAPAYPAAYPGVIAVTAVDKNGRIYRRANQGAYIAFAALGVRVPVSPGKSGSVVSGTSFAAPLVAAEAAHIHKALSPSNALQAVDDLKKQTVDKGPKGRDPIYGWGVVQPD